MLGNTPAPCGATPGVGKLHQSVSGSSLRGLPFAGADYLSATRTQTFSLMSRRAPVQRCYPPPRAPGRVSCHPGTGDGRSVSPYVSSTRAVSCHAQDGQPQPPRGTVTWGSCWTRRESNPSPQMIHGCVYGHGYFLMLHPSVSCSSTMSRASCGMLSRALVSPQSERPPAYFNDALSRYHRRGSW